MAKKKKPIQQKPAGEAVQKEAVKQEHTQPETEASETAAAPQEAAPASEPAAAEAAAEKPETDAEKPVRAEAASEAASAESGEEVYSFRTLISDTKAMLSKYDLPNMLLSRCIAAYFLTAGLWIILLRKQSMTNPIQDWRTFIEKVTTESRPVISGVLIAAIFIILTCVNYLMPKSKRVTDPCAGIAAVLFFDSAMLWRANNFYLSAAVTFISLVFIYYEIGKLKDPSFLEKVSWKTCGIISLVLTVGMMIFIGTLTIDRHMVFGTASHDFGLFAQMFHNLGKRFSALTTCEREYPISHFKIHASYIYYLLVPVYKLIPKETTLLAAQAVLAMGGAVPTFLIAKKHNFKGIPLIFITAAYTFAGYFVLPCFYDFHENAFLPTLLMWLLWAVDSEKHIASGIFAVLVCITKEDAPLYVLCIGLFLFFERKGSKLLSRIEGLIYAAVSGGYMLFITNWLTKNGDGQLMTSTRFGSMMIDPDGGLTEVIKNVLLDPAYFFSLLIREETLRFFMHMMLPVLFLPFLTKKIRRFWLMVPFIVMNLAIGANYGYAADINFHYVFGTGALLLYMAIINLDDLTPEHKNTGALLAGAAAFIFFIGTGTQHLSQRDTYRGGKDIFDEEHEAMSSLPQDSVVCATAFLLPHCCTRDYIYLIDGLDFEAETDRLITPEKYDYIVMQPGGEIGQRAIPQLESLGWTIYKEVPGRVVIYQNPASPVPKPDVYAANAS
ncbi:MAG: DUF2079 domain-containing protein [Oscillospiraceae bacterium]|nr:DUF2079 domain-containing protein [Oscillospiraceae bacterium]